MSRLRRMVKPARAKMARRRHRHFLKAVDDLPRPLRVLDVGGSQRFWELVGMTDPQDVEVTLMNIKKMPTRYPNFRSVVTDARDMRVFKDDEFDVVFSNSVIEHVGTLEDQTRMASEVARVGKRYFVQTPNRYFPIEPHFYFPFFQFLPVRLRVWLVKALPLASYGRMKDREKAEAFVKEIRLMNARELQALFPGATLLREKTAGLTKSFMVLGSR